MRQRIVEEYSLLVEAHPDAQHAESGGEDWFLVPHFSFPPGWLAGDAPLDKGPIAFKLNAAYPTNAPYGFVAPAGITFKGSPPGSPGSPVNPPFLGAWQHFSWAPETWLVGPTARQGANILDWIRGINERLREGA